MNPTNQLDFQPDLHPDADTLSAFLERQLAPPVGPDQIDALDDAAVA